MRYNTGVAAVLLLASIVLLLSTSLYITPLTVSDTNPASYVIVPLLMLPVFLFFSLKHRPVPALDMRSVALGAAALSAFVLAAIALRLYFSFLFVSFRIDMLLMPLALVGLVSLFFGVANIQKFKWAIVYSLLASPAVLYALISQSGAFAQANSFAVYALLKPLVHGLGYSAPMTLVANGYSIGIGQSCVSLGIFVSLVLFLIPVAYFYDGRLSRRVLWLGSGLALLLVLNLARMASISLLWFSYGPSSTLLLVHQFVGTLLFYAIILVMVLTAFLFGLRLPAPSRARRAKPKYMPWILAASAVLAFAISAFYVYATLNYATALSIMPTSAANAVPFNFNNASISAAVRATVNSSAYLTAFIANQNGTEAIAAFTNSSMNASNAILALFGEPSGNVVAGLASNNRLVGQMRFFGTTGLQQQTFELVSNSTDYLVYNINLPLLLPNASSTVTGVYVVIPASDMPASVTCSSYDAFYSYLYNLPLPENYSNATRQRLIAAECMGNRLV